MGIESRNTSLNQVPKLHKWLIKKQIRPCTVVDYGAGKYNKGVDFLKSYGFQVLAYDKYNRPMNENIVAKSYMDSYNVDLIACANVLNVCNEEERQGIYGDLRDRLCPVLFTVYEGDKSGLAKETKRGTIQQNKRLQHYIDELRHHFSEIYVENQVAVCYP